MNDQLQPKPKVVRKRVYDERLISANVRKKLRTGDEVTDLSEVIAIDLYGTHAVPAVSGGSGTGAVVDSVTVDTDGQITDVVWKSGSSEYATGDILTFTQHDVTGKYTIQDADHSDGVLQDLSEKTIRSSSNRQGFSAFLEVAIPSTDSISDSTVLNLYCGYGQANVTYEVALRFASTTERRLESIFHVLVKDDFN